MTESKKELEINYLPLEDLNPNPWNTNKVSAEKFIKLKQGLEQIGWFKAIVCRELPDGSLEILGGYHRVLAAMELGWKTAPVQILYDIADSTAKQIGIMDNGDYGQDDQEALSKLLQEFSSEELQILHYDDSELSDLLSFTEINFDALGIDEDAANDDLYDDDDDINAPSKEPQTHKLLRFKVHNSDLEDVMEVMKSISNKHELDSPDSQQNMGDALVLLVENYKNK